MEPASAPRKRRFIPKAPPRRAPKQEVKAEPDQGGDENDDEQARELLKRFNEASIRKPRVEKKAVPIQAAFGYGATSTSMKSFGDPKGSNDANASAVKEEKEYSSPFDQNSYYPITLPLRPPYSGNPEIRDKEEFGEGLEESTYDENSTAPANDLGLMEENKATSMLFFKFLPTVPIVKRSATTESHEVQKDAGLPGGVHNIPKPSLSDLPPGFMGKMQVYKSGAIKLKLGDTLFHVNPGMNCDFAQDAVVINKAEKSCTILGEVNKRAILTPDISSVLNSIDGLSL